MDITIKSTLAKEVVAMGFHKMRIKGKGQAERSRKYRKTQIERLKYNSEVIQEMYFVLMDTEKKFLLKTRCPMTRLDAYKKNESLLGTPYRWLLSELK